MNDRSEFNYGIALLREIASERLVATVDEGDHRLLEAVSRGEHSVTPADLYLTCFCAKGDLLSQWRGYGAQDSRYCLKFDPAKLAIALPDVGGIQPVVYDRDRQRSLLTRILEIHLGIGRAGTPADLAEWVSCVNACCLVLFAFLKNPAFVEEDEWRAMLLAYPGDFVADLDFGDGAGIMKPYLPLVQGPCGGPLPLTQVIAGASRSVEQSVRSAKLMLTKFGYDGVPVDASEVPLSG